MKTNGYEIFGTQILPDPRPRPSKSAPKREARMPCYGLAQIETKKKVPRIGIVSDVSTSGAFVWMEKAPRTGSHVKFALLQPGGGEAFRCDAVVMRSVGGGVGLSFAKAEKKLPGIVASTHVA